MCALLAHTATEVLLSFAIFLSHRQLITACRVSTDFNRCHCDTVDTVSLSGLERVTKGPSLFAFSGVITLS